MINKPNFLDVDIVFKDGRNLTYKIYPKQIEDVMSHVNSQNGGFISLLCPDGRNVAINKESILRLEISPPPIDNLNIEGIRALEKLVK